MAANVYTAFSLCSLNADFNLNRIERSLSLVKETGAEPVIALSKRIGNRSASNGCMSRPWPNADLRTRHWANSIYAP